MGKMNGLNRHGYTWNNLRAAHCLKQVHIIPFLLLVFIFSFSLFSAHPSLQESKGVRILEVKRDGETIILYERSYALLIGVSEYEYWPDLKSITREIELLGSSLKKHGFIVEESLNPTCAILKETIENFIYKYGFGENNRLFIFFSGHGYTRKNGTKGYIVPVDAANPIDDEIEFLQKAIDMNQILTWAKKIESKHALFVFDSCFSGTVFKSKNKPTPSYISEKTWKPVRQFITAGGAGETVPAKSYFLPCFIRGIEGEADAFEDRFITATELALYLQKEIMRYKIGQTPQYGKIRDPDLDQGDFVFILPNIKSISYWDLAREAKEKYNEDLKKMKIRDFPGNVQEVGGQITLVTDVDSKGNITIKNCMDRYLDVVPIGFKNRIIKTIKNEIVRKKLISPKDDSGTLVNLVNWRLVYKVGIHNEHIVLSRNVLEEPDSETIIFKISSQKYNFNDYNIFRSGKIFVNLKVSNPIHQFWIDWGNGKNGEGRLIEISNLSDLHSHQDNWNVYAVSHEYNSLGQKNVRIKIIFARGGKEYWKNKEIKIERFE